MGRWLSGSRISLALLLLAAGVLLGTLILPLARATFPGTDGQIVFVNSPESAGSIVKINPDGSGLTQLTRGLQVIFAAVSPDGNTIVFDVVEGALCTIPINGGDAIMIPGSDSVSGGSDPELPFGLKQAAWTPDGLSIVFTCDTGLCLIPAAGGSPTTITGTAAGDLAPDVKPDGSEIAFQRLVLGAPEIFTIPIGGGSVTQRTDCGSGDECSEPTYSPDGASIALDASACSGAIGVIASGATLATPGCLANSNTVDTSPAYSPEGNDIVLAEDTEPLQTLAKITTDGVTRTNIYIGVLRDPKWAAVAAGGAGGAGGSTPCPSTEGTGGKAPEALCGGVFFNAQKKAEGKKAKAAVKFVKAGCNPDNTPEIGKELDEQLAPIIDKANAAIEKSSIGGAVECDPELQALLPIDPTDLLDGSSNGAEFLDLAVEDSCDNDFPE